MRAEKDPKTGKWLILIGRENVGNRQNEDLKRKEKRKNGCEIFL